MGIFINVEDQKMHDISSIEELVSGSQNFVRFTFNLGKEWDNLLTFAQFRQNDKAYNQYLDEDGSVYLPAEIKAGIFTLMLYGSNDKTIATTNYLTFRVNENNLISDAQSTEISESLYNQLVTKINAIIHGEYITSSGGEIFNDYDNNKALSQYSHAEGASTTAGTYAFNILAWDESNKTYTLDSVEGLAVGDIFSVKWNTSYINYGKITVIEDNIITVDNIVINAENFETKKLFIIEKPMMGTEPFDEAAHAEGSHTQAVLYASHAEGGETQALDRYAHAEGRDTQAGYSAHSEGRETKALGEMSHAEGGYTEALGHYSHAEGYNTHALSTGPERGASHAEGGETIADGQRSHAEGSKSKAYGVASHSEGLSTTASGQAAHAEGEQSTAGGQATHAEGFKTFAQQSAAHSEGWGTSATGMYSHSEGYGTEATNTSAHAEGYSTKAYGIRSHSEGIATHAEGDNSHAEGNQTTASGPSSHSEGELSASTALASHAEGYNTTASGAASHSEGTRTRALNERAHAEGGETLASGRMSHAEGDHTVAKGESSHAEGIGVTSSTINPLGGYLPDENYGALGKASHAEGGYTTATGEYSHAGGFGTKATAQAQTAIGKYNDENESALFIVGNGSKEDEKDANGNIITKNRKNAFTVSKHGFAEVQITGETENSVTTRGYVDSLLNINPVLRFMGEVETLPTTAKVGNVYKVNATRVLYNNPIIHDDSSADTMAVTIDIPEDITSFDLYAKTDNYEADGYSYLSFYNTSVGPFGTELPIWNFEGTVEYFLHYEVSNGSVTVTGERVFESGTDHEARTPINETAELASGVLEALIFSSAYEGTYYGCGLSELVISSGEVSAETVKLYVFDGNVWLPLSSSGGGDVGDIEAALDRIIEIQNSLIGGESL